MDRTSITCSIFLVASLGAPALAAPPIRGALAPNRIIQPPRDCPSPVLAQCEDQGYLDSYCGGQNRVECAWDLAYQADADAAGWGGRSGELPLDADNPQYTGVNHPGGTSSSVVSAQVEPYDYSSHYASQLNSLYIGTVTRNQTLSLSPSVFAYDPRIHWQGDGSRISSCEEFVYKRYRSYSRFEDDVAPAGTNYAAAFWVALYGDSGLTGSQISDDEGHPTFSLTPQPRKKNVFFSFSQLAFNNRPDGMPAHAMDIGLMTRHPSYFGSTYWAGGWDEQAWASYVYETAYTSDQLERLDLKVAAFEDMLARRDALLVGYRQERDFIWRGVCIRLDSPAAYCGVDPTSAPLEAALLAKYQPQFVALDDQIDAAQHEAEALGCLDDGMTPCDWSPHQALRALDRQMNEPREASFKLCNAVLHNDFRTVGSRLADLKAAGWPDAGFFAGDLNQSAQMLEYVLEHVRAYVMAYVGGLARDPATGEPMLGDASSDNAAIGNWAFGADYNYGIGFQIEGIEAGVSYGQLHAWATFGAGGHIFGIPISLVDGTIDVHSHDDGVTTYIDHTLSFNVLGDELLPGESGTDALTFHIATGNSKEREFFRQTAIIPVGPIPVKVSGWITGVAGVNVNVDGGVNRFHSGDAQLDALSVDLRGKLDPYAELVAHASASVDLVLIEAGVKGRITLVRLDLPFTMGVGVTMKGNVDGTRIDSILEGSAQLDLVLHTLDGGITLFVDTPFHNFEKDLLTWEGYQSTWPLFKADFPPINLSDLRDALTGGF